MAPYTDSKDGEDGGERTLDMTAEEAQMVQELREAGLKPGDVVQGALKDVRAAGKPATRPAANADEAPMTVSAYKKMQADQAAADRTRERIQRAKSVVRDTAVAIKAELAELPDAQLDIEDRTSKLFAADESAKTLSGDALEKRLAELAKTATEDYLKQAAALAGRAEASAEELAEAEAAAEARAANVGTGGRRSTGSGSAAVPDQVEPLTYGNVDREQSFPSEAELGSRHRRRLAKFVRDGRKSGVIPGGVGATG